MQYIVEYEGSLRTKTEHLDSKSIIVTDAPKDNQGQGEAFSPTDLFAVSLATCMMTLMGMAAKKCHLDMKGSKMQVDKTMMTNPRRIGKIGILFFSSLTLTDDQRLLLEKAALECPVHKSLHPDIVVDCQFIWGSV